MTGFGSGRAAQRDAVLGLDADDLRDGHGGSPTGGASAERPASVTGTDRW